MEYNHISNFLEVLKKKLFKNEEHYEIIINILNKYIKKNIKKEDLKIKNQIIYINCSPAVKSEIYINKNNILKDLSVLIPNKIYKNIN